jgi:tRNA threonylcarbamoyladenosine biosynthesis protein TsaB
MPLSLAIDCALRRINLGVAEGESIKGHISLGVGTAQSETLPGAVGFFLSSLKYGLRDVGLVAVTTGPGYYTGVRAGLSYACALAESIGAKVAPVSTLFAIAYETMEIAALTGASLPVAAVLPAGRGSLYAAVYAAGRGGHKTIFAPSFVSAADFMRVLESSRETGGIIVAAPEPVDEINRAGYKIISSPLSVASGMLKISRAVPFIDPAGVRANYLREPYAD